MALFARPQKDVEDVRGIGHQMRISVSIRAHDFRSVVAQIAGVLPQFTQPKIINLYGGTSCLTWLRRLQMFTVVSMVCNSRPLNATAMYTKEKWTSD